MSWIANVCVNALILQDSKMMHSDNSFILRMLEFFIVAHLKKKTGCESIHDPLTILAHWPFLPLLSECSCFSRRCSLSPRPSPCLAQDTLGSHLLYFREHYSFFSWACLGPVLSSLKSNLSGHHSFVLLTHDWLQSSIEEAWTFPQLLPHLGWLYRKKNLSFEDVLVFNSLCGLGAHDKCSLSPEPRVLPSTFSQGLPLWWCSFSPSDIEINERDWDRVREWIKKSMRGMRRRQRKSNSNSKEQIEENIDIQSGEWET